MSFNVHLEEEEVDKLLVVALKDTLFTLCKKDMYATDLEADSNDEVIDACRVLVEYYGMPKEDYHI